MKKHAYEKMLPGARLWTGDMEVERDALEQIRNVTQLPIPGGAGGCDARRCTWGKVRPSER